MERKAVSGLMLILLMLSMLTLAFNIQPVRASGTIYIRADGSVDPPTAPIQRNGNFYTFTGNITNEIVVKRSNIVIDGDGYTLQGSGSSGVSEGICLSKVSNVTVKNANIKGSNLGIYFDSSSNSSISGNNITANNGDGIRLYSSSSNSISKNNVAENFDGIWLVSSSSNSISGNNITANKGPGITLDLASNYNNISENNITANTADGIMFISSSRNILRQNIMSDNHYNFFVGGYVPVSLLDFVNDVDTSNTVDNKLVYYWVSKQNASIPIDAGYVVLVNCTNIRVENLTLTKNYVGILLAYTVNSNIAKNNITNNAIAIWLGYSSNNSLSGNNITNNEEGVSLSHSSCNNIFRNNITANRDWYGGGIGIRLYSSSSNNNVSGNILASNDYGGIYLSSSSHNSISANSITDSWIGMLLYSSSENSISNNNITANLKYGTKLESSSNNLIYHNNFVNNPQQVLYSDSSTNFWDDGYPSGGNYWSEHTDVDVKRGTGQNLPGSDGIGDTPYIINADNADQYPLMNPYGAPPPPTHTLTITTTAGGTTNPVYGTYGYTANSSVQVTAIPNTNYLFDHWELDGINKGSSNPYTVLVDKKHTLKTVFSLIPLPNPVGGYSFQIEGYTTAEPLTPYIALIAILTIGFTTIRRKTSRKTK